MKLAIASILLVAAACSTTTATAAPAAAAKSVGLMRFSDSKCRSTPLSVTILAPPEGTTCQAKRCDNGAKEVCVSGNSDNYANEIKREFKKSPVVVTVQYGKDTTCSGKPQTAYGTLANGACVNGKQMTINKDRSVVTKFYADPNCTGAPTFEQKEPDTITKGQCINGQKIYALRSATDRL